MNSTSDVRFFLDTNLFVYSFEPGSHPKRRRADELIREAGSTQLGIISTQVVQEFFSYAFRKATPRMTGEEATFYLENILEPLLAISTSAALIRRSLGLHQRYSLSWYDSLIVAAAIEGRCKILYSEDLQHGLEVEGLRVENPFA
jgi:predicted nucleic acid-binding protein